RAADFGRSHPREICAVSTQDNGAPGASTPRGLGQPIRTTPESLAGPARAAGIEGLASESLGWSPPASASLAKLRDELAAFVGRFVVMSSHQRDMMALWAAHTHVLDAFDDTPFLHVFSPEPESGKTRALEVLSLLVRNPWKVLLPSEPVLYRKISRDHP